MSEDHDQEWEDRGTIVVLIERFQDLRLPRAERMLERVRAGERLTDEDIGFLTAIYQDQRSSLQLLERHPEYHGLAIRVIGLYTEIIVRGLENEKSG